MTQSEKKVACPCCGYQTLSTRGNFDICQVCWWEDDGQDNEDANIIQGGANYNISLLKARFNFIKFSIYDPSRQDLWQKRMDPKHLVQLRKFSIEQDDRTVSEVGTAWRASLDAEEDPFHVLEK